MTMTRINFINALNLAISAQQEIERRQRASQPPKSDLLHADRDSLFLERLREVRKAAQLGEDVTIEGK